MVVGYSANGGSFIPGKPQVWSQESMLVLFGGRPYDLTPDGKRFAALLYPGGMGEQDQKPTDSITVQLNFFDELKRRTQRVRAAGGK